MREDDGGRAPAPVPEQWKAEMEERFGLLFVILDRGYLTRVRQERGFGVNAWRTRSSRQPDRRTNGHSFMSTSVCRASRVLFPALSRGITPRFDRIIPSTDFLG